MTSLLESPRTEQPRVPAPPNAVPGRAGLRGRLHRHRASLVYVLPLMALAGLAGRLNMGGAPQRIDDEGTYTAQAYAVQQFGELAHYTYWYDHPPLGWLQIAGWTRLSDAFDRYDVSVLAGREAMVAFHVASVGLLWLLGRRMGMGRVATGVALGIYAVSPLAVQFSRTVYLDNVAVAWLLAAFVLALSSRQQLPAFAGAAVCLGVAVLSKETFLLMLPFLAWTMWRSAQAETRRYTLSVAGSLFMLVLAGYAVYALIKGEVLPGAGRVSLWEGIEFQLVSREGSGSLLDATTQAGRSVRVWLTLDPVLAIGGTAAAAASLFSSRLRPLGAAFAFHLLVLLKPGYLPVPFVVVMVPFAALLVPAVLEAALRRRGERRGRALVAAAVAGAVVLAAVAVPVWFVQLRGLMLSDPDEPMRQAQEWLGDNADRDARLLVDDAVWVDLVRDGFPRENVVWYYKADTDPAVYETTPNGWLDYDYVLLSQSLRRSLGSAPTVQQAVANGTETASFGSGATRVQVFQVQPQGAAAVAAASTRDESARALAGQSLAANPALDLTEPTRAALTGGQVDSRVVTLLASLAGRHDLAVTDFPVVEGERGLLPARTVVIEPVEGAPADGLTGGRTVATDLAQAARDQVGVFRPDTIEAAGGRLVLQFGPAAPSDLLPVP